MANYRTSADLVTDILFRGGELTDGTSDFNAVALTYLNRAYQILWMGGAEFLPSVQEDWWWLRKSRPGVLTIQPAISNKKTSVVRGSTAITFATAPSPAIDKSLASGWFFQVTNNWDVFEITAHTSGSTAATLDSVYTGTTSTGASALVFKIEYALATDVLKIESPMRVYQEAIGEIDGVGQLALDRDYPLANITTGVPRKFAFVGERKVRFSHAGPSATGTYVRTEYDYLLRPADLTNTTGEPLVPMQYRKNLADLALFYIHMDKNDNRADGVGAMAKSGILAMSREHRQQQAAFSRDFGKILVRQKNILRPQAPLRTQTGLIIG